MWHHIVTVMKNPAELEPRIEFGPWSVATVYFTWVQTEFGADSG